MYGKATNKDEEFKNLLIKNPSLFKEDVRREKLNREQRRYFDRFVKNHQIFVTYLKKLHNLA